MSGLQPKRVRSLIQRFGVRILERLADDEQRLPQTRSRGVLADSAPQKRGELVAWVSSAERKSQVSEHRLRLAAGHTQKLAGLVAGLEAPEQGQSQLRHAASGPTPYHFPR